MINPLIDSLSRKDFFSLSEEERKATGNLSNSLSDLDNYVRDFHSALTLFDFCAVKLREIGKHNPATLDALKQWPFIAARDGAMTIYHFGVSLRGIRAALGECPTVNRWVDAATLRTATNRFLSHFPKFKALRHAVAHDAELTKNKKTFEKHAFSGTYTGPGVQMTDSHNVMLQGSLLDRQFTATHEGQIISYEISQTTLNHLVAIKTEFWAGFRNTESDSTAETKPASQSSAPSKPDKQPT